ncbi:tRNA (adenosine(37)-N6)-threonylcarbamoyltransferase complex ATPase subunit type 1 TsaE [candidate division WWE3 bacterium RIFCSPHIGHO2_01_FULL_43_9]|uniref:tRNA threonylcarbamoyladenosine biosynthesis protein TsaE n=1 Tax=candidate division WWE3 bacterium RIFCSPHIGHO2_01_FULL_43_9 TaxID=1802618 RepID=A0A1F4V4H0_UNCKA|nr:MAG: tRNA (adenosine(37)-N6)-threonylcarbamoyltransferase complex ATPase subunit type 1 TsaE [candidate division WWE3 bacterium RIFCSPHIGHO2_01_FULL_43_9]
MEIISGSTEETKKLAEAVAKAVKPGMVLALYGDLGSGKTTFTRYLVEALGFMSRVQSPTFVLHRRYTRDQTYAGITIINHLDFYRLTSKDEVYDLGLSEMLAERNSILVVEWPELAEDFLPGNQVKISFSVVGENTRRIVIKNLVIDYV